MSDIEMRTLVGTRRRVRIIFILLSLGMIGYAPEVVAGERSLIASATVAQTPNSLGSTGEEDAELTAIYTAFGGKPIWTTEAQRRTAASLLASLQSDGVNTDRLGTLPKGTRPSRDDADIAITRSLLRAAHVLTTPLAELSVVPGWSIPASAPDVAAAFIATGKSGDFRGLFDLLRPSAPEYQRMSALYLRYLRLADNSWKPIITASELLLKNGDENTEEVAHRLTVLGDLPDTDRTMSSLKSAVMRFQARHGLAVDGRVGAETLAELNVPPAIRAEQIAINLVYWRLLPRAWPQRYIKINTAAANLELIENGTPAYAMRTIVGDPGHPTPIMSAIISAITFNPAWTVPLSIAVNEFLPRLRRNADYLRRNNIVIVGRDSDPFGLELDWRSYTRNYFPFQLRQLPGSSNALGGVKFEMPNKFDIYLHDTPERNLFARPDRALSHGCVRLECANALAERLVDPKVWLETDLASALKEHRTVAVKLAQPLPVYLLYFTAFVDGNGQINFRRDLYGRDAVIRHMMLMTRFQEDTAASLRRQ